MYYSLCWPCFHALKHTSSQDRVVEQICWIRYPKAGKTVKNMQDRRCEQEGAVFSHLHHLRRTTVWMCELHGQRLSDGERLRLHSLIYYVLKDIASRLLCHYDLATLMSSLFFHQARLSRPKWMLLNRK